MHLNGALEAKGRVLLVFAIWQYSLAPRHIRNPLESISREHAWLSRVHLGERLHWNAVSARQELLGKKWPMKSRTVSSNRPC